MNEIEKGQKRSEFICEISVILSSYFFVSFIVFLVCVSHKEKKQLDRLENKDFNFIVWLFDKHISDTKYFSFYFFFSFIYFIFLTHLNFNFDSMKLAIRCKCGVRSIQFNTPSARLSLMTSMKVNIKANFRQTN